MNYRSMIVMLVLLILPLTCFAQTAPQSEGDYCRILEDGSPEQWPEAVKMLIPDDGYALEYALGVLLFRLNDLETPERIRIVNGIERYLEDHRVLNALEQLLNDPEEEVRDHALETLLAGSSAEIAEILRRYQTPENPHHERIAAKLEEIEQRIRRENERAMQAGAQEVEEESDAIAPAILIIFIIVAGFLGLILFLWAFRMLQLRMLVTGMGVSKIKSVALGQVALVGEAQPFEEIYLQHPVNDELCLYYAGADQGSYYSWFYLEDETGRILVNPKGVILLSENRALAPGDKMYVFGNVAKERFKDESGRTREELVVRKNDEPRPVYLRLFHFLVQGLLGGFAKRGSSKLLFSDPRRCFWIWDDHREKPFSSFRENAIMFATFLFSGAWIVLFTAAVIALMDKGFSGSLLEFFTNL